MKTQELNSLALKWQNGVPTILDQQLLPQTETWIEIKNVPDMIKAIKALKVRGAPLIGVAACLSLARSALLGASLETLRKEADELYEARPTAVNLMNGLARMKKHLVGQANVEALIQEAENFFLEDVRLCEQIAQSGVSEIPDGGQVLTHCNTGGLATAGAGTALAVIKKAHELGKKIHVWVDETRPLLQGGRLTTWELEKAKIPYTLITDNMAGYLMSLGKIDCAIVGADRIAVNGDFANKIGTYSVAVNCFHHQVPFYVAAPWTTVDPKCLSGKNIPIEERDPNEVRGVRDHIWSPANSAVFNPSFDVTPAKLVTGWIFDRGVYRKDDIEAGKLEAR